MQLRSGKNMIPKGSILFERGEIMTSLAIVLSGKISVSNSKIQIIKNQGSFLGLVDFEDRKYSYTYEVVEDSVILGIPVSDEISIQTIIDKNADYRAIMISSVYKNFVISYQKRYRLQQLEKSFYQYLIPAYQDFLIMQKSRVTREIPEIRDLEPYIALSEMDDEEAQYYEEASRIPLSVNKTYFSYSRSMVSYQTNLMIQKTKDNIEECYGLIEYIENMLDYTTGNGDKNLLDYAVFLSSDAKHLVKNETVLERFFKEMYKQLEEAKLILEENTLVTVKYSLQKIKEKISAFLQEELTEEEKLERQKKEDTAQRDYYSLEHSLEQIIYFSGLSKESMENFCTGIEYFVNASDRMAITEELKNHKKMIINDFFDLYMACFYRSIHQEDLPVAVRLFLNYGFVDERLLTKEQLIFLCGVEEEQNLEMNTCQIYTFREWLEAIRNGQKNPSKNEFDEDYTEHLRTMRKQGEITEEEQKKYENDNNKKIEFEVKNMFRLNDRVCYGQPSTYVPVLYKDVMLDYMEKSLITKKKLIESVERLRRIDYSVFYREIIYSNSKYNIVNDSLMKNVFPDIIILPVFGLNASMWQEISGRYRQSPGRFIFPAISNNNIDDLMIKLFGRFHWEMTRCVMGIAWNDVKVKSLTSEYMDYIQFYRKNRDISEEWRQKIKSQIQKSRNNAREFFLFDYENWMKSEANGSMKLNKVARELLATYVPFTKEIRSKLTQQKPFETAMARYERNKQKKIQEIELKMKAIKKDDEEIPKEILDNYAFYTEF